MAKIEIRSNKGGYTVQSKIKKYEDISYTLLPVSIKDKADIAFDIANAKSDNDITMLIDKMDPYIAISHLSVSMGEEETDITNVKRLYEIKTDDKAGQKIFDALLQEVIVLFTDYISLAKIGTQDKKK